MNVIVAILIGLLFAGGLFCILRRSMMKLVIGIMLLSQGSNLLVFSAGGSRPWALVKRMVFEATRQ